MNKEKKYERPEIDIIEFQIDDLISSSGCPSVESECTTGCESVGYVCDE